MLLAPSVISFNFHSMKRKLVSSQMTKLNLRVQVHENHTISRLQSLILSPGVAEPVTQLCYMPDLGHLSPIYPFLFIFMDTA